MTTGVPSRTTTTPLTSNATRDAVLRMLMGMAVPQLVYVAVRLSIPDVLLRGEKTAETVAECISCNPTATRRLLRGLVDVGLLTERVDNLFSLSAAGRWLCASTQDSLRWAALHAGEIMYPAWGALLHTVRTGETAFKSICGSTLFDYLSERPELREAFHRSFAATSRDVAQAIVQAYDFSHTAKVLDVGGGYGALLCCILDHCATISGVLFDVPAVVPAAQERIATAGLSQRCEVIGGDFLRSVPAGADIYVLKNILHDWPDDKAAAILRNCRQGTGDAGKILVIETLLPERSQQRTRAVSLDLVMMVLTGGRERTLGEFDSLFRIAGFHISRLLPLDGPRQLFLLEGKPVGLGQ